MAANLTDILGDDGAMNLFNQVRDIWIIPELKRRIESKKIDEKYQVSRAQVIMDPDKESIEVRLNQEVKAFMKGKLEPGIKKQHNEPVLEGEIKEVQEITLTDNDSPNAGHLTMILFKGNWLIHMDFRQHKERAKQRYEAAHQFYEAAKFCFEKKHWRAFTDNIFSAVELLATAQLFVISEKEYVKKQSHNSTRMRYNAIDLVSEANKPYKDTLNGLHGIVDGARYFNRPFNLSEADADVYLKTTESMIAFTLRSIT